MTVNKLVIGILAHVDSGKTTLAEDILYETGSIKKLGRVDHKDSYLDNYSLERDRGITIFSKQAVFSMGEWDITLLDTPGHVDFCAEMERTLQVLDYAILVISGSDGVQGHTKTLWELLKRYKIPVYIFVNKMDQPNTEKKILIQEMQRELHANCIDFSELHSQRFYEDISLCNEELLEKYDMNNEVEDKDIKHAIKNRELFPCIFGSALKQEGVKELLSVIENYSMRKEYRKEFAARVFKITRDENNTRLVHLKLTGGTLKVKDVIQKIGKNDGYSEKINQIRIYSDSQYANFDEVQAGCICAVTGLNQVQIGDGIGEEEAECLNVINPALTYTVNSEECDHHTLYSFLQQMEEEDPLLHVTWNKNLNEIHVQVMGDIQIEVLQNIMEKRFHIHVKFGNGKIVYKETITTETLGIGHFEPLRHYAEVHLLMEPAERGSGLQFETACSEDELAKNWQRLILTHLEEKMHIGVLTGSEITDIKITLVAGRAHPKHTEGGDFRQATYRAVRQGLREAESVILEPIYEFTIELPQEYVGRAMSDVQKMNGSFSAPEVVHDIAVLKGTCPVYTMKNYQRELTSYTKGKGKLTCVMKGYDVCHNPEEVIAQMHYDADADMENTADSVFCSHGAGFLVPWYQVPEYAHIKLEKDIPIEEIEVDEIELRRSRLVNGDIAQEEIEAIFANSLRNAKQKTKRWVKTITANNDTSYVGKETAYKSKEEYLLVDGYNIIFAWDELKELSEKNLDSARDKLMDILSNYQGYKKCNLILVFDAYKVSGGQGAIFDYHNIHVVYTKEAETADQYIEKVTHELGKKYQITVATSDRLEQMIIFGAGAKRISAIGLLKEVQSIEGEIETHLDKNNQKKTMNYLFDKLSEEEIKKIKGN